MEFEKGIFTISLDFELYWGVKDKKTLENYKENLLGVRKAIPRLLKLFDEYKIHVTWAIVGLLFFESYEDLINSLPAKKPDYANTSLSAYNGIENIGRNEEEDPFHYAPSLISKISEYENQEIASHTFSHYYCLENGQDINSFEVDLESAVKVAQLFDIKLSSLVFPRNQVKPEYLPVLNKLGISSYRGNSKSRLYNARSDEKESNFRRGLRLMDAYINISGHNSYAKGDIIRSGLPFNIPSSRFLRPYSKAAKTIEPIRLQRIQKDMIYCAKKRKLYHLWWHPHNFGINIEENLSFLREILEQYSKLHDKYGMESLNMNEVASGLYNEAGI
jgi:peptidoglycan/xylan/chitin deacetylase (PgdA/CDA1 family)